MPTITGNDLKLAICGEGEEVHDAISYYLLSTVLDSGVSRVQMAGIRTTSFSTHV